MTLPDAAGESTNPPGPGIAFLVCDLLSGTVLDELPLSVDELADTVAQEESQDFTLNVFDEACPDDWYDLLTPGKTMIAAVNDTGDPVIGWVLLTTSLEGPSVSLSCATLEHCLVRTNVATVEAYEVDEGELARQVAVKMETTHGFTVEATNTGKTRDAAYYAVEEDRSVYDTLTELMAGEGGPEWHIRLDWADATRQRLDKFITIAARIGQDRPDAVFEMDAEGLGNITSYTRSVDYTTDHGATQVWAASEGAGDSRPMSQVYTSDLATTGGWPIWEARPSISGLENPEILNPDAELERRARAELTRQSTGARMWSLVGTDEAPRPVHEFGAGDAVYVNIAPQGRADPVGGVFVARVVSWVWDLTTGAVTPTVWETTTGDQVLSNLDPRMRPSTGIADIWDALRRNAAQAAAKVTSTTALGNTQVETGVSFDEWKTTTEDAIANPPPPPDITPTAVGAPKITGGVGVLLVSWDPVSNPSSFEVEVYLSATSPVAITGDNLVGTTSATQFTIKELADGTTLSYVDDGGNPVVYYVALRAVNSAGDGPVSAEASGSMHQITGPDVAANYVYAGNLIAGQITGGRLDSEVIVGGDIYALGAGGERVSLSGKGFSVTGPTSAGNPIFVNFPTDGAKPNIFSGTVEANTLDVVNGATLRSDGNHVASKSTLNLSSGVQPPQSPPATDVDWPILDIDTTKRAGILGTFAIDAGDCQGLTWDTVHTRWVTVQNTSKGYRIWRISTTGVTSVESDVSMSGFPAPLIQAYGIVSIGGVTHILDTYFGDWYLNTVTNYTRINPDQWPTLGTDGTNLLVAETVPSTGAVRVRQYNPANLNSITATYTSPDLLPGEGLAGIARGTFDYGATRMITAERYTRVTDFWSMDSTGVRQPNEDWPSVSGNLRGFAWDGTNFWALGSSGNLRKYSSLKWTTESSKWWVSYTWADTDVTSSRTQSVTLNATTTITATAGTFSNADIGSRITASGIPGTTTTITGVLSSAQATLSVAATDTSTVTATIFSAAHETPQSPRSSFTMKKRATLTVTTAALPAGSGAADDPNAVNIYVGRGAGSGTPPDLARTSMFQQSSGPTTLSTAALVFSGTNPPTANNFPSTAPGKIASTGGGFSVDGNADGSPGTASFWRNIFNSLTAGANGRPIQALNFDTGTYTFTAGSVTVAHGLGTTPKFAAANGNAPRYHFNVTDVDATNMTISCFDDTNAARTGDTTMRWLAIA